MLERGDARGDGRLMREACFKDGTDEVKDESDFGQSFVWGVVGRYRSIPCVFDT